VTARRLGPGRRVQAVADPIIPILDALIEAHPGTRPLGQGVVAFGPPPDALARVRERLHDADTHKYHLAEGTAELREALATKLERDNATDLAGRRLIVTAGANMAFVHLALALLDPGDEVIFQAPYYFNYPMAVDLAGGRSVFVPATQGFALDVDAIAAAITPATRAVVTVSPDNPTGVVQTRQTLTAVNELCRARGVFHVCDEVYEYFTFGPTRHFSPASLPASVDHTIALYSFSKAYGMAGWRVGYMVVPERLFAPLVKVQDTNIVCPPVVAQELALGALEAGPAYVAAQMKPYLAVRSDMIARLEERPDLCALSPGEGALYVFPRVHTALDSMTVGRRLVAEFGVAVVPGEAFGVTDACHVRLSFAGLEAAGASDALARLIAGFEALVREAG
jgi:aspartate/methionine/tyrosine aminotransferase